MTDALHPLAAQSTREEALSFLDYQARQDGRP